jgi:hypothetical protein
VDEFHDGAWAWILKMADFDRTRGQELFLKAFVAPMTDYSQFMNHGPCRCEVLPSSMTKCLCVNNLHFTLYIVSLSYYSTPHTLVAKIPHSKMSYKDPSSPRQ